MFRPFGDHYTWNLGANGALRAAGHAREVYEVCQRLVAASEANDLEAWFREWSQLADRTSKLAQQDEAAKHPISASRRYLRAATYYITAERFLPHTDPRKMEAYKNFLDRFRGGVKLGGRRVEWVDIPFEEAGLPALFVPAPGGGDGRAPTLLVFDGLDTMKESIYMSGWPEQYAAMGIASLIVDHPGVGEALRLRNLPTRYDMDVPATTCVDYLETRPDVDPSRIGMLAMSLGGYYAPRSAAFEKRFKCCVAWGAQYDYHAVWRRRLTIPKVMSSPLHHMLWVFGVETLEEAMEKLKAFTLEGVASQIECPLLIIHGQDDSLVPVEMAHRLYDNATGTKHKELKIFTADEGGSEHCVWDNPALASDYILDWLLQVL